MRQFRAIFRVLIHSAATRARVYGFVVVGLIGIGVGWLVARSNQSLDPVRDAATLVDTMGLTLLCPIAALVFGSACLGDLVEDGTMVYLWMRPVRRWKVGFVADLVTLVLALPLSVVPTVVAASFVSSDRHVLIGAVESTAVATVAYSALFVLLGLVTNRALVWGIGYLLIFESFVARGGKGLGFLSIHSHALSLLSNQVSAGFAMAYFADRTALLTPLVFAVLAAVVTSRRLNRLDVA